jgi:hypothetical protein
MRLELLGKMPCGATLPPGAQLSKNLSYYTPPLELRHGRKMGMAEVLRCAVCAGAADQ